MQDYEQIYKHFVESNKSLLIAPAGYGKTHTIAECLRLTKGHQLILTHTHAGVASIKDKIKKTSSTEKCTIETISSFAQKYVESFYCKNDIPDQDNSAYFPFIIQKAITLFGRKPISDIIKSTYQGLFVDEYQDCTISQHELIFELSKYLPIHILGDPLQGIFGFNGEQLIDFSTAFQDFDYQELNIPWRWKNSNPQLGDNLNEIRKCLINKQPITISNYPSITKYVISENDLYNPTTTYYQSISNLIKNESSILIIHPESANKASRINLIKKFNNRIRLVEAIDSKEFYEFSHKIDNCTIQTSFKIIYEICTILFNKSEIDNWFNDTGVKEKRNISDKQTIEPIKQLIAIISQKKSLKQFSTVLKLIKDLPGIICYRKELFNDLCKAITTAHNSKISVFEAMTELRNIKRRIGRRIIGKCIGTTLLTKGLEFDTVVLLNAHKFSDMKNFYVALTRASKKLIVYTEKEILTPYN